MAEIAQAPEPRKGRASRGFLFLLVVLLGSIPLGYLLFLRPAPPPPAPAPVVQARVPPRVEELKVSEVVGRVELRHGSGAWTAVSAGESLAKEDSLRTQENASVTLTGAGRYKVKMQESTEVAVKDMTDSLGKFLLEHGVASAEVEEGGHQLLEFGARGSDAVARSQGGAFVMSNNGQGTVGVGVQRGEVELSAAGKAVIVRAGQQSVAFPGGAPSDPVPIPPSLFLKVEWPESEEINRTKLVVAGATSPGSIYSINGQPLVVDERGRFKGVVMLRQGANKVSLKGMDLGGRQAESKHQIYVDTTAPNAEVEVDWGRRRH